MAKLFDGTLQLSLPEMWHEETVYSFVAPAAKDVPKLPTTATIEALQKNLLVSRYRLGKLRDVESIARAQLQRSQRELAGFCIIAERQRDIDGHPAVDVHVAFAAEPDGLPVQQRQVFVCDDAFVYMLIATFAPSEAKSFGAILDGLLDDVRFGRGQG